MQWTGVQRGKCRNGGGKRGKLGRISGGKCGSEGRIRAVNAVVEGGSEG